MNEVVKYDNYMNCLKFSKFNQVDMNFLIALCSRMKDKDTQKISLTFDELKELTNYRKSNSINQFANDLERMNKKLMKTTCRLETETEVIMFVLFPTFKINRQEQLLTVSVNEDFKFILNELVKNFTRFDLREFIGLGSKYAKNLYRLLKQFRTTGRYEVSINDFRNRMDCPESYSNKYVMDLIIKPSLKELDSHFQDLKCEPQYAHKRGRPVTGYIFTFTPESIRKSGAEQCKQKEKNTPVKNRSSRTTAFHNFNQRTYDYEALEQELLNR